MTVEPSANPESVQQAREQIRGVVSEIGQLVRADLEPAAFYEAFVSKVVEALAAVGGTIWTIAPEGHSLRLAVASTLPRVGLPQDDEGVADHARLLGQVVSSGEATIVPLSHDASDRESTEQAPYNPTPYLLLLAPLTAGRKPHGVVEIFQRPGAAVHAQRGYLRFLSDMCGLASEYLVGREAQGLAEREVLCGRLDEFSHAVHQSLDVKLTSYTLANEACRLIDCDRVTVVVRRGRHARVEAVSGQDTVEHRADAIRLLRELVDRVMATGEPLWYEGNTFDLPPQIEEAISDYVDVSHSRSIGIVPLTKHREQEDDDTPRQVDVLGAFVVERIDEAGLSESLRERALLVARHGSRALANALTHDRVFLMPLWRTLEKSRWFVEARRLPKTISISAAVLAVLVGLCLIPADFTITAQGTLQPSRRRDVFVQEPGVADEVLVDHGEHVDEGAELARLRSRDLDVAISDVRGRRAATVEQLASVRRSQGEARLSFDERNRLSGQQAQLQTTFDSLSEQLQLLLARQRLLVVRSPIEGSVVTWDLKRRLEDRPVEKGQVLLSLADTKSPWELELLVPEAHAGFVARAWRDAVKNKEPMKVTYILATDPSVLRTGEVTEIQSSAEVRGEEGNTVLVRVKIDRAALDPTQRRPGAGVTGRIDCGRRSLGYVWFHDVLAFIRSKILFRL